MNTNKNYNDDRIDVLYKRIQNWLPNGSSQLKFTELKKRVLNKTIANPEETLKSKDLKEIANYLSEYNKFKAERGESKVKGMLNFSDLLNNVSEKQINNLINELDNQNKPSTSLIPIKGISKVMQARLRDLKIVDVPTLLVKCKDANARKTLANKLGVDIRLVTSWMKQAILWRVEGMTTDLAYLLVMVGIRNVEDLAQVDKAKILPILKGLVATHIDFEFEESELDTVLKNAREMVVYNTPIKVNDLTSRLSDTMAGLTDSLEEEFLNSIKEQLANSLQEITTQSLRVAKRPLSRQELHVIEDDTDDDGDLIEEDEEIDDEIYEDDDINEDEENEGEINEDEEGEGDIEGDIEEEEEIDEEDEEDEIDEEEEIDGDVRRLDLGTIHNYDFQNNYIHEDIRERLISEIIEKEAQKLKQASAERIQEILKKEISGYQKENTVDISYVPNDINDVEPVHLFDDKLRKPLEILNGKNLKKGLDFLDDIQPSLPLPRKISGYIVIRKKDELIDISRNDSVYLQGCRRLSGALVEIQGVVSPSDDLKEAVTSPSCVTDGTGRFVIVLPERYSMKETITIVVSIGSKRQEFIKTASEVLESVEQHEILNRFYELDAIGDEIDYIESNIKTLNGQVAYLEDDVKLLISELDKLNAELSNEEISDYQKILIKRDIDNKEKERALKIKEKEQYTNQLIGYLQNIDILNEKYHAGKTKLLAESFCAPAVDLKQAFDNFINNISSLEAKLSGDTLKPGETPKPFVVVEEIFNNERMDLEKALPKVKLMGNDDKVIRLSTDTAPSKIYTYSMLQRLVEPEISTGDRQTLSNAIDVMDFKESMITNINKCPHACTLGMGYVLNMHQAWVPDGFALGDLLYSLVLAPGEEQRLIVRENKQTYEISDEANAIDADDESYALTQDDDTNAAFNYAMDQLSQGKSSYSYSASSWSIGGSASGGAGGAMIGLSGGYSKSSGKGSASASQSNSHSETSSAAQNFQHNIKSASSKISQAKRMSMEMATSDVTDSVATKIIANHNHSHAMTIQYWEVMRRYKLETCIDSVDLVLFVPLKLINFLPTGDFYLGDTQNFDRTAFTNRYDTLLHYYDTLYSRLPSKYRSGLNLIKKYSELTNWVMQKQEQSTKVLTFEVKVRLLTYDNLSATLVLKNGKGSIAGSCNDINNKRRKLTTSVYQQYETSEDLRQGIIDFRNQVPDSSDTLTFTFNIPDDTTDDDVSYIRLDYSCNECSYSLKRDDNKLITIDYDNDDKNGNTTAGKLYQRYIDNIYDYSKNDKDTENEHKLEAYYERILPEAYLHPIVKISSYEMKRLGTPTIMDAVLKIGSGKSVGSAGKDVTTSYNIMLPSTKLSSSMRLSISTSCYTLHNSELLKMESTLHHIASNPMKYSQIVWGSLSDDERVMMLEQFTINMNFDSLDDDSSRTDNSNDLKIPLLNCVNVKNLLGFYGNCMILPFTFPQRLAKQLGKTAADIQNSLYRYHTNNFRVPTTTISLPTKGMIGEAVLGETNVSEEIDITRFWNWQDSPIDKMEIDSSYLNGNDYLQGKSTKDVTALNMQGATAATPVTVPDLVSALVNKQTPTFDNITGLDQLKEVLNAGTNSAAAGRDNAIKASADVAKAALASLSPSSSSTTSSTDSSSSSSTPSTSSSSTPSTSSSSTPSTSSSSTPSTSSSSTPSTSSSSTPSTSSSSTPDPSDTSTPDPSDTGTPDPSDTGTTDPETSDPETSETTSDIDMELLSSIIKEAVEYIKTNGDDSVGFFKSKVSDQYPDETVEDLANKFAEKHGISLSDFIENIFK